MEVLMPILLSRHGAPTVELIVVAAVATPEALFNAALGAQRLLAVVVLGTPGSLEGPVLWCRGLGL